MIEVKNLTKIYRPKKGVPVKALDNVSLKIEGKGMVFILGKSGSGKSTLLNMLGGLDRYDEGEVIIKGKSSKNFSQSEFDSLRNTYVGFIFQEYNILNEFTVGANIALAMELQGKKATNDALNRLLEQVDLVGFANRKPNELSGGQKQRVAIARALIKDPEIIMADEPTGALDSNTGRQVFETLQKLSKEKLVIVISHDREFAEYYGDRVIEMADGKVISDIIKYKTEAETVSDGVKVIDDKILHIKKGYELTAADLGMINNYLKKSESDTIISIDEKANTDFRKQARIDENGNRDAFVKTDEESLGIEKYTDKDFKLIKSRLPAKNAFKIGASGLKSKPFRLFMTILLSSIAFTLFGVVDTMAAYNKVTTTVNSIEESGIDYISYTKNRKSASGWTTYTTQMTFSDDDIQYLDEKFPFVDFYPVITTDYVISINNFADSSKLQSKIGNSYYTGSFSGLSEIQSDADVSKLGFDLIAGHAPQNTGEILVPLYIYEEFKIAGLEDTETGKDIQLDSADDIVDKKIAFQISGKNGSEMKELTVSGVADTHADKERYSEFLPSETDSALEYDISYMLEANELQTTLAYGSQAVGYVYKGFIDENFEANKYGFYNLNGQNANIQPMYSTYNSSDNYATGISYITTPDKAASKVYSLSGKDATNLSENEAIVSSSLLLSIYNSSCENSADRISLPKTDIMYLIPEYATAVEDYATATLVSNRAAFDSFIADNDLSGKTDEEIIDAYKKYYFSALYGSEAVAYAGKSSQDFINEVKAKAVADYMNKLQTKILSLPKLRFEIDNYMTSEQTTAYFDIAGFYIEDEAGYDDTVFIPQAAIDGFDADLTQNNPYSFALAKMPDKESDLKKIVAFGYSSENDIGYTLQNSVTTTLSLVNDVIEEMSEVLLYIGIGFAVFAAFLMMNFIATSISYKKREIGILRAVGARSTDVFGIFFSESFIIACINWIISVVFTVIATVVINSMLRKDYDLQITLLNFGIRQIALILGVALVVALIASLLPVARIARKKPIDAIRNH